VSNAPNTKIKVYEKIAQSQNTSEPIRPGGLKLTEEALAICNPGPRDVILDVGCGTGVSVEYLIDEHNLTAVGLDPSPTLLYSGRTRNKYLPLVLATGEHLPLKTGSIEIVLSECSLSVMDNPDSALSEFHRILKPGGKLAITDLYARRPENALNLNTLPIDSCLNGAWTIYNLMSSLHTHHFRLLTWEDRSQVFKRYIAHMILTQNSIDHFWCTLLPQGHDPDIVRQIIADARPGYFLCIAQREANS